MKNFLPSLAKLKQASKKPLAASLFIGLSIIFLSCKKDNGVPDFSTGINDFIRGLAYDPDALMNVQEIGLSDGSKSTLKQTTQNSYYQNGENEYVTCINKSYNLQQNAEQVAILRPTNGIIWPGALVKINTGLLDGMPEPITLKPAPVTLSIDLPGMGDNGVLKIKDPSNANVQSEIDNALNWWNNNKYVEGYRNATNSSLRTTMGYSSEQLAIGVGLNVKWASGDVSAKFNFNSSNESYTYMSVFKQVFYTVTCNTPENPASVFDPSVALASAKSSFDAANVPGYVHSVSYGRIIMVKITTNSKQADSKIEAAVNYANTADATFNLAHEQVLKNSTIEIITIGGDAGAALGITYVTANQNESANNSGIINKAIVNSAYYNKNNPGVPVAYTVKYLKDNKVAKMGYTTDYTAKECMVSRRFRIMVTNKASCFTLKGYVHYLDINNTRITKRIEEVYQNGMPMNKNRIFDIPAGASDIYLDILCVNGIVVYAKNITENKHLCLVINATACSPCYYEVSHDCGL